MKKKFVMVASILSIAILFMGSNAMASFNNKYGYDFIVPAYKANVRSTDYYYRGTGNTQNAWKVALVTSNEPGGNTCSNFWLEVFDGSNVSSTRLVQEAAGDYYTAAYQTASYASVWLTCENNNNNNNVYENTGYWDEETSHDPN
ncbi:MAG: DUF2712 domain-containing protein [Eubacteriaceae bacterium]